MSKCIFCDVTLLEGHERNTEPEARSREHSIPEWLLKHLKIEDTVITYTLRDVDRTVEKCARAAGLVVRPQLVQLGATHRRRLLTAKLPDVCRKCNGGWMSALEVAVMELLKALIAGKTTVASLSLPAREALTRWMIKTAYVLCAMRRDRDTPNQMPLHHVSAIERGEAIPAGIHLFSRFADDQRTKHWSFTGFTGSVFAENPGEQPPAGRYKVTVRLGPLALLLAYMPPDTGWRYAVWPEVHDQSGIVWPEQPDVLPVHYSLPLPDAALWPTVFHLALASTNHRQMVYRSTEVFNASLGELSTIGEHDYLLHELVKTHYDSHNGGP